MPEEAAFNWQHDAHLNEKGEVTLFDNHEVNPQRERMFWSGTRAGAR